MPIRSVVTRRAQLDSAFTRVAGTAGDIELQAHFARYLCVLVSGYVEQCVQDILADFATHGPPRLSRYVARTVARQNVNTEVLMQIVENFDADWRDRLAEFVQGERKAALDSVVINRHNIAHGRPSSISYVQVSEYYERIKEIIDYLGDLAR